MQVLDKQESNLRLPFSIEEPTLKEAKAIVRGRVFNMKQYEAFRKNNPQFNLPVFPRETYKNSGWAGGYDFLGTTKPNPSAFAKRYWADVKSGKRVHTDKMQASLERRKNRHSVEESSSKPVISSTSTTLQDKHAFIALAKKLGVYDSFRPAFKTLFTYEELLDMINL